MKKKVNGKAKGSSFELQIAKQVAKTLNLEYGKYIRRTPGSGSLLTRSDLWIDPRYRHRCNLYIECKKRENWNWDQYFNSSEFSPVTWYKEAADKLKIDPDYDPESSIVCLVFTKNRSKIYAMLSPLDYNCLNQNVHSSIQSPLFDLDIKLLIVDGYYVLEWKHVLDLFKVKE